MAKMGIFEKYRGAGSRHGGAGRITPKQEEAQALTKKEEAQAQPHSPRMF